MARPRLDVPLAFFYGESPPFSTVIISATPFEAFIVFIFNAVKSDLEAAQAELQILKQEVIKSSKNPFGAGRKPKLTVEQVEQVKMLSAEGLSVRKIAAKMDCSAALICKLLKDDHK